MVSAKLLKSWSSAVAVISSSIVMAACCSCGAMGARAKAGRVAVVRQRAMARARMSMVGLLFGWRLTRLAVNRQ
jgi:hypothetical protein